MYFQYVLRQLMLKLEIVIIFYAYSMFLVLNFKVQDFRNLELSPMYQNSQLSYCTLSGTGFSRFVYSYLPQ